MRMKLTHSRSFVCITSGLIALALQVAGCSFSVPHQKGNSVKILIDDSNANAAAAAPLFNSFEALTSHFGTFAAPTSTADFSCFAVNVTGQNIGADGTKLQNCTSVTGFHGVGQGKFSSPTARGTPMEVDVSAGQNRTIDVYGVYPPSSECGATQNPNGGGTGGGGYFLGRVTQALAQDSVVTVPIVYAGGAPEIVCTGGGGNQGLQISSVFPYGGLTAGGALINVNGSGFLTTAVVKIGGVVCPINTLTSNTINCTAPALAVGTYPIVVDNLDGHTINSGAVFQAVSSGPFVSVDANTNSLDFGSVTVGQTKTLTLSFINTGSTNATLPSTFGAVVAPFAFAGGAYPGTGGTCTAAGSITGSGGSCTVVITYSPVSAITSTIPTIQLVTAPNVTFTNFTGTGI
jgi:hypothetical protein